jgi:glycosyltransferase involved in cell wall biosynthesis/folate-dependent phosphoribosylglycinamide formyltransferase PurN
MSEALRSPSPATAQPLRIMHLSRAAETLNSFMIPTMQEQIRLGHEVFICTDESVHTEPLRKAGFEVMIHGMKRSLNPGGALQSILRIRRFLREKRIDVVICHNSLAGQVGRIGAWLAGTPRVLYFAHGLACGPAQSPLLWRIRYWAERVLAPCTSGIIIMNDYDENIAKVGRLVGSPDRVYRIPGMGVDLTRFTTEPSPAAREKLAHELGIDRERKLVLCVARLIPEKGVAELVEAAHRMAGERRDVVFLLAGTGPLLEDLRARVRALGIEQSFRVLGWRNDIHELMKCADILALPSYYMEGLPVSILEAMACGKPVVSTHHKGCEDAVVDGETGYLVPVRAVDPLAERLRALLDDATLRARMGQAGRRRVEQVYELDHCTRTIVEVLEAAMARGREPMKPEEMSGMSYRDPSQPRAAGFATTRIPGSGPLASSAAAAGAVPAGDPGPNGTPFHPPSTHGLRIVYLTTDDPLYLPTFFDRVLGQHHARTEGVYIAPPLFKNQSTWQATLRYIRTFGMPAAAQLTARVLEAKSRRRSIATVCQKWGVRSAIVRDVNAPAFLDELRSLSPDVIISVSCPLIFRKPLIELPPHGILNLHGAILPQYRGVMPAFRMMANGEKKAGVSIYFVNEDIDAGDLCGQRIFDIEERDSLDSFLVRSKAIAADLLLEVLRQMEDGTVTRTPLNLSQGSYYRWPDHVAVTQFRMRGRKLW